MAAKLLTAQINEQKNSLHIIQKKKKKNLENTFLQEVKLWDYM